MAATVIKLCSALLVVGGLYLVGFGHSWAPMVLAALPATSLGAWIELLVPFLPIAFIGLGAALFFARD